MKKIHLIAAMTLVLAAPALAQDVTTTLQVETGTVMTSTGAEFQTAATGADVVQGARVMVAENSSVLVRFPGDCVVRFSTPGVHVVPTSCVPGVNGAMTTAQAAATAPGVAYTGVATTGGALTGAAGTAAIVGGVVAASAAGIESTSDDGDPVPPVSP